RQITSAGAAPPSRGMAHSRPTRSRLPVAVIIKSPEGSGSAREILLGRGALFPPAVRAARHVQHVFVMLARRLRLAGPLGGAGRSEVAVKPVRKGLERFLVLGRGLRRPAELQQEIAQLLPGGEDLAGRDRVGSGLVLEGRGFPKARLRFVLASLGEGQPAGRGQALDLDLVDPPLELRLLE